MDVHVNVLHANASLLGPFHPQEMSGNAEVISGCDNWETLSQHWWYWPLVLVGKCCSMSYRAQHSSLPTTVM